MRPAMRQLILCWSALYLPLFQFIRNPRQTYAMNHFIELDCVTSNAYFKDVM